MVYNYPRSRLRAYLCLYNAGDIKLIRLHIPATANLHYARVALDNLRGPEPARISPDSASCGDSMGLSAPQSRALFLAGHPAFAERI